MPNQSVGREVVRGTICRDRYVADVALLGADRIPEGTSAPLLVEIKWREQRDGALVPGVPEDQQPIVLTFAKTTDAASGEITFDGGAASKGFAGDTRQLLTMVGAHATVGDADDVALKVSIEGAERAALPLSVGEPALTLTITADEGTSLVNGRPAHFKAVPAPAGTGTYRWFSVPDGLTLTPADDTVEVTATGGESFTLFALFDPDGDGPVAAATLALTAGAGLFVHVPDTPLVNGWVYWAEGGTTRALRTDASGRLLDGTAQFAPTPGATVQVAYSRGSVPLPVALVTPLLTRTVPAPPDPPILSLPAADLVLTAPEDVSLWPLSFAPHDDAYSTAGIAQGAALWNAAGHLTITEHGPAPAPPARPALRPLTVTGRATGSVAVRLLDAGGATLAQATATAAGGEFSVTLAATAPGPATIAAVATPPAFAAAGGHVVGVQAALVADSGPAAPGPVRGEADETLEVDFLASPQLTLAALTAQTRARRMLRYRIGSRARALGTANVVQPEMPLWMAELQLVGITAAQLDALLAPRTAPLHVQVDWTLALAWDGPDANAAAINAGPRATQSHNFTLPLPGQSVVELTHGTAPALAAAPGAIGFPVAGRRLPGVLVDAPRTFGRQGGATQPSLVIEWQPRVVDGAGNEIIRGGNGTLAAQVALGSAALDVRLPAFRVTGENPQPDADVEALIVALVDQYYDAHSGEARIQLLSRACWETTVLRVFRHESGVRHGYQQFDSRGALRSTFTRAPSRVYGLEDALPLFGPPHGYGVGQLDSIFGRGPNDDEVWSFVENIRSGVRLLMEDKATAAYALVSAHLPAPVDQRTRAVYQREIVRRYNGGTEFEFSGGAFVINPSQRYADSTDPSKGPNLNLRYPNQVLGTGVVYFTSAAGVADTPDGAATVFPWPITFTAANFGPGT